MLWDCPHHANLLLPHRLLPHRLLPHPLLPHRHLILLHLLPHLLLLLLYLLAHLLLLLLHLLSLPHLDLQIVKDAVEIRRQQRAGS